MFTFLFYFIVVVLGYVALKVHEVSKTQAAFIRSMDAELKELKKPLQLPKQALPYGWFDEGRPTPQPLDEDSEPLEVKSPDISVDAYQAAVYIAEFKAFSGWSDRRELLRHLQKRLGWVPRELLDLAHHDESAQVRAWPAGHLNTDVTDYKDGKSI